MTEAVRGGSPPAQGHRRRRRDHVEWDDIVLREDIVDRIIELLSVVPVTRSSLCSVGVQRRFSYGRGLSALFRGHPHGKTMIAGLIPRRRLELFASICRAWCPRGGRQRPRHRVRRGSQCARVLRSTRPALFGKRTEVRSCQRSLRNLETNYLLQRIDRSRASCCSPPTRHPIDEAFRRRLPVRIDSHARRAEREQLWRSDPRRRRSGPTSTLPRSRAISDDRWLHQEAAMRAAYLRRLRAESDSQTVLAGPPPGWKMGQALRKTLR